ncbi:MAG: FkbM family methyltransferase [Candidatus Brennerbacteria bacterium]
MRELIGKFIPRAVKNAVKKAVGNAPAANLDATYSYPPTWLSTRKFYGQYGEDLKILPLFAKGRGYFVEIGAMEGIRFSNTYLLELMGWEGICMEPHPDYFELLEKNRPRSITIRAAAGKEDRGSVDFYTNFRGSMSTLDKNLEGFFKSHYGKFFGGFKTIQVPLVTLNTLLQKHHAPTPIDVLSVDTEGTEKDVFLGFDFKRYVPRVVIAEISIRKEPVLAYLAREGYVLACTNPSNAIFCRNEEDAEVVRRMNVEGTQLAPPHPLD